MVVWEEKSIESTKAQSLINRLKPNVTIYVNNGIVEYLEKHHTMSDEVYSTLVKAHNTKSVLSGDVIKVIKQIDNTIIEVNGVYTFCRCSTPLTTTISSTLKERKKHHDTRKSTNR